MNALTHPYLAAFLAHEKQAQSLSGYGMRHSSGPSLLNKPMPNLPAPTSSVQQYNLPGPFNQEQARKLNPVLQGIATQRDVRNPQPTGAEQKLQTFRAPVGGLDGLRTQAQHGDPSAAQRLQSVGVKPPAPGGPGVPPPVGPGAQPVFRSNQPSVTQQ